MGLNRRSRSGGGGAGQPPPPQDPPDDGGTVTLMAPMADAPLVLAEYNSMVDIAMRFPRNPQKALSQAIQEMEDAPELAEGNWYSIPYKNHKPGCQDRKGCNCPTKPVEGLSVKAAYAIQRPWRNLASKCMIVRETDSTIYLTGMARDLETNTYVERPKTVPRTKTLRNKTIVTMNEAEMVREVSAAASKVIRDAILNQIPDWWKTRYWKACRAAHDKYENERAGGAKKGTEALIKAFETLGVTVEMIEKKLGHPVKEITDDERMDMRGYYNAINSGEAAKEAIFGSPEAEHAVTVEQAEAGEATSTEEPPDDSKKPQPKSEKPPAEKEEAKPEPPSRLQF